MENNLQAQVQKRNLPRDVFLHLFAMVTLYWSAVSFITLCWQYINHFFPDTLNYNFGYTYSIRFALSSLIIVFPLFIFTSWQLNRIYRKELAVRESKIRKWLIYLTLFIASLVIIGDLIFVINNFLNGAITARFILKAFSVLLVTAVIFGYYLDDVRREMPSKLARAFALATSIIVFIFFAGAFVIVGSPVDARLAQFDQQKTNDLSSLQYQIVNYWQKKGTLPQRLTDLNDSISGYVVPTDPQSHQPYEYTLKDALGLSFELCAKFNLSSTNDNLTSVPAPAPIYPYGDFQNWNHGSGRVCFQRKIDSQLYSSLNKPK
jgi:hypothetical protein